MNKINLCILFALILLVAAVSAQEEQPSIKSAALLRNIARKLYPNASDRQIVKKLFPGIKLLKKKSTEKLSELISALSDSRASDCNRYCAGSTGDYKISCWQHCQRYGL